MQTKKLFSSLVRTGTRLTILASMLMAAVMSNITPAFAAPSATLTAITLGAPSGTLTAGTAGSITYLVTVTKNTNNNNSIANLSLTWSGGTPTGVTISFSPASVSWTGTSGPSSFGPRTSTLTITTTALTPAAVRNFTVRAQRSGSGSDFQTVGGTLTVSAPLLTPTITFGAAPAATFPGGNFTVSATTNSNGALTYSRVSGPCAFVSGASFGTSGVGTCVVQASTAATSTYAAGSAQQSVTISAGSGAAFDLYAVTGTTTTLPGLASLTVWGYNTTNAPVSQPGGPVLIVNQGDSVTITLHNQLSFGPGGTSHENTGLLFQGQSMIPDTTGVAYNGTKTYTFTASQPGTFLYEAGLITGKQHQVAMGLHGALIVRPTGFPNATLGQAYSGVTSAFDTEQVLVLSELDTLLNSSANPAAFDMRSFNPRYFLINGKAYPNTDPVVVASGNKVLLRYVNAGLQAHAMTTLGFSQNIIGQDGSAYAYGHSVVTETIATGQTLDTIVTIPGSAILGTQYPLYDASLALRNNTGNGAFAGVGGMLTTLSVGTATPPPPPPGDTTGPTTSALGLSPNPTNGSVDVTVSATISDVATGNSNIDQAQFYIDTTAGSPTAMTGTFGTPTASVTGTIPSATLGILVSGNHTIYVRGHDASGNWGPFLSIILNLDKTGPTTTGLQLSGFDLSAIGNDTASGNSNVTAAEYWVDNGSHVAMTIVGSPAPISNFTATIPSAGLQGPHVVSVRSQDSFGNWGAPTTINLNVADAGLPTTSNISASPNPNNGSTPLNTSVQAVRVTADFSDVATGNSNIVAAEGFLDVAGTNGTGFVFIALDGNFNSPAESGYADIPLAVLGTFTDGAHPICVHAKDASGNWGVIDCSYNLNIDRTPPTVLSITRVGTSPTNAPTVQFLVTFSESVTAGSVTAGNFTLVENLSGTTTITSVTGTGATRTVTATTGTGSGTIGLNLTSPTGISDVAGNAMTNTGLPFVGEVYTIIPTASGNLYFSTFGNSTVPSVSGTADDADIYFYNGSAFSRVIDVTAITNPLPGGANVDGFDRVNATQFYMSFNGNVTVPGISGTVADEDVVFYDGSAWSLYFDGSVNGVTSNLDAISIVGGNLYFSLSTNTTPPGVSGPGGDDADIYRWNGGSSYTRIFDATALGWSGNNVDGFVYVDADTFYLSYEPTSTTVAGLGTVQDEDVVKYDAGVWSVYFDGTSLGLTSNALDVDAFDIP